MERNVHGDGIRASRHRDDATQFAVKFIRYAAPNAECEDSARTTRLDAGGVIKPEAQVQQDASALRLVELHVIPRRLGHLIL